ncbi:hypothetical protein KMW28_27245 [Flammeovirga yaeyamensis]|uniref:Uncharacterized protein n=1 Tax=Flammeovirga yaeyamensis TaxID=367791 RepID=A0AAX1NE73_9BACT|nr:hypothetical protein [Flammeovirga yaeyamensis]MBB3700022.1 hypothetical protein [Flammeovirga yaeyamensis]NMF37540.1 hypothetical protein [Flammeovirga yaeyamensis]QWG04597.1 hypothetical protein KMW28_27245 [Flammeovirga yaeyamensis]
MKNLLNTIKVNFKSTKEATINFFKRDDVKTVAVVAAKAVAFSIVAGAAVYAFGHFVVPAVAGVFAGAQAWFNTSHETPAMDNDMTPVNNSHDVDLATDLATNNIIKDAHNIYGYTESQLADFASHVLHAESVLDNSNFDNMYVETNADVYQAQWELSLASWRGYEIQSV